MTDLDCISSSGIAETLHAGQSLSVEPTIVDNSGQAWTPLFLGMIGSRCYVRAEVAQFLDRPAAVPDFILPYTLSDETIDGPTEIRLRAGQHILLNSDSVGVISIGIVEPASLLSCGSGGCWAWSTGEGSLELSAERDNNIQRTVHVVVTP